MKNLNCILLTLWALIGSFSGLNGQILCNPDTQAPTIVCNAGLQFALNPETMSLELAAADFVQFAQDNCSDTVRLRITTNLNASTPPEDSTLTFTTPGVYTVAIWVLDDANNFNICFTSFVLTGPGSQFKHFEGVLFSDMNGDCLQDAGESELSGLPIEAVVVTPSGTWRVPGLTDAAGHYDLEITDVITNAAINIEVRIGNMANNGGNCPTFMTLPAGYFDSQDVFTHDFAADLTPGCHQLEVDIASFNLRRCFNNAYYVNYCNYGAETAVNATVEIEFDPFLDPTGSTLPWTAVNGNTYTFSLGNVAPGACGSFSVNVVVSCNAVLGQTHCSTARIFPESNCGASYTGPELSVSGDCVDGEVVFTITNTGAADMVEPLNYYVVEDVIMFMSGPVQLNSGQSTQVSLVANGSTYRLELPQVSDHPFSVLPSASVEGCGLNSEGVFSLGFVTQFPQDDNAPALDIDCRENSGSYDPNDKQVFPRGATDDHLIAANTDLEYQIRFQNTGTDTAFTVVILDTLSENLDAASIRPGAASHPYTYTLLENNVLRFSFNDILLPDSNVNVAASQGFVKFRVRQQPDLATGTEILNDAAIYFDFNEPVITNRVQQVIGTPFVTVNSNNPIAGAAFRTRILPNPMNTIGLIQVEGLSGQSAQFHLYHPTGALLWQLPLQDGKAELHAGSAPAGLYYYTVTVNGRRVDGGKVIFGGR